jgi:hypothetical protein
MKRYRFLLGLLALGATLALSTPFSFAETEPRPDLLGRVTNDEGAPLTNATVFVYSAGPKKGTATLCPYCYPDCRKKAKTDADGRFKIDSLDPQLRFRLLVVAGGYESRFITHVDPAVGPRQVTIQQLTADDLQAKARIAGMVMDQNGNAVPGATISPEGVEHDSVTQWGGTDQFVDPTAVTDDRGLFLLLCKPQVVSIQAVVEAPNVAKRWVVLKPGSDHLVRMVEGVTVAGLVKDKGMPVRDAVVGLTTSDRACGNYYNCDELATDAEGRFLFPNVPAEREFVLFAKMDSLKDRGVIPSKTFTTGKTGSSVDIGTIEIKPAHRLAGRIVLTDGQPLPPDTRLLLAREKASDTSQATLDDDGRFEFQAVPAEPVSLNLRLGGYKLSHKNPNLDWLNGCIVGTIDRDINDLTILLEPGQWRFNLEQQDKPDGVDAQPYGQPLRGAKL